MFAKSTTPTTTAARPMATPATSRPAVIEDGAGNALDTSYYRYYPSYGGFDGLKYVFNPDSFARLSAAVADPFTATDQQVAPYADNYFEYDAQRRVSKEVAQGMTCDCSNTGGQGTFTYSYLMNFNNPDGPDELDLSDHRNAPRQQPHVRESEYRVLQQLRGGPAQRLRERHAGKHARVGHVLPV